MKRLYYKLLRNYTAAKLLAALIANPERYKYIAKLVESGEINNNQATQKNITKAIIMADQFIDGIKQRNNID